MLVQPYLTFDGRAEEAIEFYRSALGAEVQMKMRFSDHPDPATMPNAPPGNAIMHASLRIGDSTVLLSDGQCSGAAKFQGFALSLTAKDTAEAERRFHALAEGGEVRMPLAKTFFSPAFGMVTDKFGVGWMVYVAG